jgi:hypothetical protein
MEQTAFRFLESSGTGRIDELRALWPSSVNDGGRGQAT